MSSPTLQTFVGLLKHVEAFSCLDVDEAPDSPGLYAWYGTLKAGPQDWEMKLANGNDLGHKACRSLLQKHTTRHASPPLAMEGRGAFTTIWKGDLRDTTAETLANILAQDGATTEDAASGDPYPGQFQEVLASERTREILLKILQIATPILAAPVYIGVATSLRTRLKTHTDLLFKLSKHVDKNPDARHELQKLTNTKFASRAVSMGFTPDSLTAWTLNLTSVYPQKADQDALRMVAESAEWLLNRWYRPMLGRR
jgi:hypothetical protein